MAAPVLRIPRFRASRVGVCGSEYVCEGIEVGDRVGFIAGPAGVITLCEPCCERTEAAAELAALDPTARLDDPDPAVPSNVAEAVDRLRTEDEVHHQYSGESVALLLALIDQAAEEVAARERERWHDLIRRAARRGSRSSGLAPETYAGLHMAASMIKRNRETLP